MLDSKELLNVKEPTIWTIYTEFDENLKPVSWVNILVTTEDPQEFKRNLTPIYGDFNG